jgi:hypothetical protein
MSDKIIEAIDRAIASIDDVQATLLEMMAAIDKLAKPTNVINHSFASAEDLKPLRLEDLRKMGARSFTPGGLT